MQNTSFKTECLAGTTTFVTLSSILLTVPILLTNAGLNPTHTFIATCLSCALASALSGFLGRLPIALGPGLTMTAFFVTELTCHLHLPTDQAFGMIALSALLMHLLIQCNWLAYFKVLVPNLVIQATTTGLGLLFFRLAFDLSGSYSASTLQPIPLTLWLATTALIFLLKRKKIQSAMLIGIILSSLAAHFLLPTQMHTPTHFAMHWILPSLPDLSQPSIIQALLTMTLVLIFDNTASLYAFLSIIPRKEQPNRSQLNQVLSATSIGSLMAAFLGTTPSNVFLESKAGILAGGRKSTTAFIVAFWCLIAIPLAPWMHWIAKSAIASAMTIIALALMRPMRAWIALPRKEAIGCFLAAFITPATLSPIHGITLGLALYYGHALCTRGNTLRLPHKLIGIGSTLYLLTETLPRLI